MGRHATQCGSHCCIVHLGVMNDWEEVGDFEHVLAL